MRPGYCILSQPVTTALQTAARQICDSLYCRILDQKTDDEDGYIVEL